MTILDQTVSAIIGEVGETVEIVPHEGYQSDGIWESDEGYNEEESFEVDARIMRQMSNEELEEAGFTDKGECLAYFDKEYVSQGDMVIYSEEGREDDRWIVAETRTNQLGDGVYRQVVNMRREEV